MWQVVECVERSSALVERMLYIWRSSVETTHTFLPPEELETLYPEVRQGICECGRLFATCDKLGAFWGFMGVEYRKIELLFVHPAFRGQGAGTALVQYAIEKLHARYVDVNEQNIQGLGFYEHLGFGTVGKSMMDDAGRPYPILHLKLTGKLRFSATEQDAVRVKP